MKKSIISKSAKRMKMGLLPEDWRYQGRFKNLRSYNGKKLFASGNGTNILE